MNESSKKSLKNSETIKSTQGSDYLKEYLKQVELNDQSQESKSNETNVQINNFNSENEKEIFDKKNLADWEIDYTRDSFK